jgi:hypothetical protein
METFELTIPRARYDAFRAINTERAYQDAGHGNAERHAGIPKKMTPGEAILYMHKCLRDAEDAVYKGGTGALDCLDYIRKVSALGVQIMENYGAPLRPDRNDPGIG